MPPLHEVLPAVRKFTETLPEHCPEAKHLLLQYDKSTPPGVVVRFFLRGDRWNHSPSDLPRVNVAERAFMSHAERQHRPTHRELPAPHAGEWCRAEELAPASGNDLSETRRTLRETFQELDNILWNCSELDVLRLTLPKAVTASSSYPSIVRWIWLLHEHAWRHGGLCDLNGVQVKHPEHGGFSSVHTRVVVGERIDTPLADNVSWIGPPYPFRSILQDVRQTMTSMLNMFIDQASAFVDPEELLESETRVLLALLAAKAFGDKRLTKEEVAKRRRRDMSPSTVVKPLNRLRQKNLVQNHYMRTK